MKTITGNNQHVLLIDNENKVKEPLLISSGTTVITNNDDVFGNDKVKEITTEKELFAELENYTLDFDPLPEIGQKCEQGKFYNYNGKAVLCRQSHIRTEHAPETIPALFSFYREDDGNLAWIPNEEVEIDDIRTYNDVKYKCIQAHMTLEGWEPASTPSLWQEYQAGGDIPQWVQPTGGHDAYNAGDLVIFNGNVYESLINANVWSPTGYPAGWRLIS